MAKAKKEKLVYSFRPDQDTREAIEADLQKQPGVKASQLINTIVTNYYKRKKKS